jgi:hypothetical protein
LFRPPGRRSLLLWEDETFESGQALLDHCGEMHCGCQFWRAETSSNVSVISRSFDRGLLIGDYYFKRTMQKIADVFPARRQFQDADTRKGSRFGSLLRETLACFSCLDRVQGLDDVVVDHHDGKQHQEHKRRLIDPFLDVQADVSSHQAFQEKKQNHTAIQDGDR